MEHLLEFCSTDNQTNIVKQLIAGKSHRKISEELGVAKSTVSETLNRVRKNAAKHGVSPDRNLNHHLPYGQVLKGVSSLVNTRSGETLLQWVKSSSETEELAAQAKEILSALKDELPRYPSNDYEPLTSPDLLNLYVITDFHMGMYSDADECGDDYSTKIAEKLLVDWFRYSIDNSPASETGVLAQLGDFLHTDGFDALTPQSKHLLDADTRFQKTIRSSIRVLRKVIDMLLTKHKYVKVLMCSGNHDIASSAWLREVLPVVYENEKRITFDTSLDSYYCVEHGDTSLFFHHGHKRRVDDISSVFVSKYRQVFGKTKYSYGHLGHLHHNKSLENNLMIVEQHRTLAPKDAYATHGGWISGRDAKVITYHREFGEVMRMTINPEIIK